MKKPILQYEPAFGVEEQRAVAAYMKSGGWFTENQKTVKFEQMLGRFLKTPHVSCVNNGTISLAIAMLAAGLKAGDQVIVPDITMIATANAARLIGIEPVLIDINPTNLCLDLKKAFEAVRDAYVNDPDTARIKAVWYVSLNGRSHSADDLAHFQSEINRWGVILLEDAAQSFGSKTVDGKFVGTTGLIGSFSFSPHKIISTGQGGCLITPSQEIYESIERLKDFGRLVGGSDIHDYFGINSKFTDIQAVIGTEQFKKIKTRISFKKKLYWAYEKRLRGAVNFIPTERSAVPWFVDIYTDRREKLAAYLKERGIQTRPLYPALHNQPIYSNAIQRTTNVASMYSQEGLWLPSSFNLKESAVNIICGHILDFMQR